MVECKFVTVAGVFEYINFYVDIRPICFSFSVHSKIMLFFYCFVVLDQSFRRKGES